MKRRSTIQDIARWANVSKSTVSRVLNDTAVVDEAKRAAVLRAMKELEFKPNVLARGLAKGRSMTIGILTQNIGSPFYDSVSEGVIDALSGSGYSPIFVDGQWEQTTEKAVIETLLDRQVDALALIGGSVPNDFLAQIKDRAPFVIAGRIVDGWEDRCVTIDNFTAAYDATCHLIEKGHKRIAHICGIPHHQDAIDRLSGYRKALQDHKIAVDERLICPGDFSSESGVAAIEELDNRNSEFTAVFAANDATAFGARLELYRRGRNVPGDVSIVGFDDQEESAYMTPPLTTVRQPAKELGAAAARLLLALLGGSPPAASAAPQLPAVLQIRESVTDIS